MNLAISEVNHNESVDEIVYSASCFRIKNTVGLYDNLIKSFSTRKLIMLYES